MESVRLDAQLKRTVAAAETLFAERPTRPSCSRGNSHSVPRHEDVLGSILGLFAQSGLNNHGHPIRFTQLSEVLPLQNGDNSDVSATRAFASLQNLPERI
ncbi:hypothetical protein JOB18_025793 [Solea senegalensis]|uniref:Uncharacterized protein n=1 Tax=Solea senegalensis TaxID=28829 RepID=A0AAV6RB49_SOLSE|nr:hypothetical protein JOB18_025793 [Solea senegalensis]